MAGRGKGLFRIQNGERMNIIEIKHERETQSTDIISKSFMIFSGADQEQKERGSRKWA